jgi:hypothetical protein
MDTLVKIYWLRVLLGIVAAFVCVGFGIATGVISTQTFTFTTFMNSLSIALVFYLLSYYIIKRRFLLQVEKPQKLVTMGIGIYFIAWLVFWVLLYTLIAGFPPPPA